MATDTELLKRVELLEKQQALTLDLVARELAGTWKGGADSAEALLRAISPDKYGQFQAVDFPKD